MEVQSCTLLFSKEKLHDVDYSANSVCNLVWVRNTNSVLDNLIHTDIARRSGKKGIQSPPGISNLASVHGFRIYVAALIKTRELQPIPNTTRIVKFSNSVPLQAHLLNASFSLSLTSSLCCLGGSNHTHSLPSVGTKSLKEVRGKLCNHLV